MTVALTRLGLTRWFPFQTEFFKNWDKHRACLYYRTGAGKSITALTALFLAGETEVLIIAPPSTHQEWRNIADRLGMQALVTSHAKFRTPGFRIKRGVPIIADEFHQFGGNQGKGWRKFNRAALSLEAPIILCSATPNYNDAERVFCIQSVLDPLSVRGGFLEFLYRHCETEQNPFAAVPKVIGFRDYVDAEQYLISLPQVFRVPELFTPTIEDVPMDLSRHVPDEFDTYGVNHREARIEASIMGKSWSELFLKTINEKGELQEELYDMLSDLLEGVQGPVILYCDSRRIAMALHTSLTANGVQDVAIIDGTTPEKSKTELLNKFRAKQVDYLVATSTIGTGTDGLDKVCDTLIIVHDTSDDSKRKQIMGRILPRGTFEDASGKTIYRLLY